MSRNQIILYWGLALMISAVVAVFVAYGSTGVGGFAFAWLGAFIVGFAVSIAIALLVYAFDRVFTPDERWTFGLALTCLVVLILVQATLGKDVSTAFAASAPEIGLGESTDLGLKTETNTTENSGDGT